MQQCRPLRFRVPRYQQGLNNRTVRCRRQASTSTKTPEIYDVVCVGGGPAGLSLVDALRSSKATSGLKVALVETQDLSKSAGPRHASPKAFSNRCSSLTPASVRFFNEIGAWQHIDKTRIQPYDEMKVWDGVSGSRITFDWPSAGGLPRNAHPEERTIAYMTENSNITAALLARARELGGIFMLDNTRVEDIQLGEDGEEADLRSWPIVTLSNGTSVAARLLVGADGGNSPVRAFAGIDSRGWDYDRHGVVATVRLASGGSGYEDEHGTHHQAVAYQRFLPTGPAALLPLPNGLASLVWSTLPSHAALLKSLAPEDFTAMVNAAFRLSAVDLQFMHSIQAGQADEYGWRVQHTPFDRSLVPPPVAEAQAGSVASFPLKMRHADTYIGERVALLGDAAHTIHPLAGQGLNQGQADVQALVATLEEAVRSGQDIGSQLALEPYNARRYAANNLLLGVVDKLHKLYSWSSGPVVALRSVGLSAVDALGPLKGFLMQRAAGAGR